MNVKGLNKQTKISLTFVATNAKGKQENSTITLRAEFDTSLEWIPIMQLALNMAVIL